MNRAAAVDDDAVHIAAQAAAQSASRHFAAETHDNETECREPLPLFIIEALEVIHKGRSEIYYEYFLFCFTQIFLEILKSIQR